MRSQAKLFSVNIIGPSSLLPPCIHLLRLHIGPRRLHHNFASRFPSPQVLPGLTSIAMTVLKVLPRVVSPPHTLDTLTIADDDNSVASDVQITDTLSKKNWHLRNIYTVQFIRSCTRGH
jgi:hypothetical protein